ncbi:MAG: hypothetical protein AAF900_00395 [Bacteroidota bacterium]
MNTTYQPQQSNLKLAFHLLLLLFCIPIHIGFNSALFVLVWHSHKTLISIGLLVSMLWAGIIAPLVTLQLSKYSHKKDFYFFINGLITFVTLLGIDCFRLVYDQFNPNHRTPLFDFLWHNLLYLDFSLERLSDELHANIFHLLYYFGGLTLSTLLFYKKDRIFIMKSVPVLDDDDDELIIDYSSLHTDDEEDDELILDDSESHTDDSDYLY